MTVRSFIKSCLWAALVSLMLNPVAEAQRLNVAKVASEVADGVGIVGETASGAGGPVFIFEEYHTSRVGQLQIAVMLVRLHDRYDLAKSGLEGALQSDDALDASWFHNAGGRDAARAREDVAVRMLAEGEIGAAEFTSLVFPDMQVVGTELASEYGVKPDTVASPAIRYLIAIGLELLSPNDSSEVIDLLQQEKREEAFEYILTADPWVREQYETRTDPSVRSIEQMAEQAREIQRKANELGVRIDPAVKESMEKTLRFLTMGSERSVTMVDYVLSLPGVASGTAVAMQIGAGHTERVIELLRSQGFALAQLTPLGLYQPEASLTTEQFNRKNERKWARIGHGTLGSLLNAPRRQPPCIGTATCTSYASMNLAALLVADAARAGEPIPDAVWPQIADLPELRIDRASFEILGYDVIFRAWLKDTNGEEREVWTRAGTLDTPVEAETLEERLLQSIADLGGEATIRPRNEPPNSEPASNEGPGDGRRGDILISRIGSREIAVFAATRDEVRRVGQLSG